MKFRTIVDIEKPAFEIMPCEQMLFVGSCFADSIGRRFIADKFRVEVNPFGVMYNPVSILHTVVRTSFVPRVAVFTLGTNRVYVLKETGKVVDNCQRRSPNLFCERQLAVEECAESLSESVKILRRRNPNVRIIVTVSPIRYAKYGYHGSQLSKATLLLAADRLVQIYPETVTYFPAYELINDELRDYRFYREDMLHPTDQAVEYIWQRFAEMFFSSTTKQFLEEWRPVKEAFAHRLFNPESTEYRNFIARMQEKAEALARKYPGLELDTGITHL
ncbi:GSCFA domain-containing protein [Hoylesella pleuritidis]|jgi:GSCFA family protein|uniref:GSCFA domain protein n=1 Tax=Hoylesella pleuritidis F0068 TaxID=1081904 RepID=U2KRX9_9BACT|nr:GSCFA domain-containing protein [Hoylesella pleuritidis]ERK01247.1 GSCFA domain protein [Hoylesella pleuritidis F0068]